MISIVVRPGDSLSLLACRYETTVSLLQAVNSLGTSTHIVVGQHLFVLAPLGLTRAC
jgi:LysM repeat protein